MTFYVFWTGVSTSVRQYVFYVFCKYKKHDITF